MDHRTTTMAVVVRRRRRQGAAPKWGVVRGMLHMRIKDAAAELDVAIPYLRRLCHQNGYPTWPGKKIRYMNRTGLMLGVDALEGSPWAALAGPSQLGKVAKTKKKVVKTKKKEEEKDITGIHSPIVNHPPREELVTLNLIDKVGSSSSSKSSN